MEDKEQKKHRGPRAGPKYEKKKRQDKKRRRINDEPPQQQDKSFTYKSAAKASQKERRNADIHERKLHAPVPNRQENVENPPPYVIAVVGPPKVGKSTLISSLIKRYTKQKVTDIQGPITIVASKTKRFTFFECPNDLNAMIDIAKMADLALLLVDASFGFEMETFEFLNILQVHGFPKIMTVLNHLDKFKNNKSLKKLKKSMKHRIWTDVYKGAKVFYLSGLVGDLYHPREIFNLTRFLSVTKFRPLRWRNTHPSILVDRMEDITDPSVIERKPNTPRKFSFYGYVRGTYFKPKMRVCLPGVGEYNMDNISFLSDPCPFDDKARQKHRSLVEKERSLYAPFSNVGELFYDKDAVYIEMPEKGNDEDDEDDEEIYDDENDNEYDTGNRGKQDMLSDIKNIQESIDERLENNDIDIFASVSEPPKPKHDYSKIKEQKETDQSSGRTRRRALFGDEDNNNNNNNDVQDGKQELTIKNQSQRKNSSLEESKSNESYAYDEDEGREELDMENYMRNLLLQEEENPLLEQDNQEIGDKASKWKESLHSNVFYQQNVNLHDLVYGNQNENNNQIQYNTSNNEDDHEEEENNDNDDDDDFFKVRNESKTQKDDFLNMEEISKVVYDMGEIPHNWDDEETRESIRDKFVTGNWSTRRDRKRSSENPDNNTDDEDSDSSSEDDDDGEDEESSNEASDEENDEALNMGITDYTQNQNAHASHYSNQESDNDDDDDDEGSNNANMSDEEESDEDSDQPDKNTSQRSLQNPEEAKRLEELKAAKKEVFDAGLDEETEDDKNFIELMTQQNTEQTELNKTEFANYSDELRVQYEGYRPGLYVRIEISHLPPEFSKYFDPHTPLIIGGLPPEETEKKFMRVNFKKHRWFPRILKNRDPLIFSIGWRRFQSVPIYCTQDQNGRVRMLKYTPQHMHCTAIIYGPSAPQTTGVIAFQSLSNNQNHFRVSGTGSLMEMDRNFSIVKKLKLTGTPEKIHKNTAFVKNMFNSPLEVAKFSGAKLKTVSGIRGQVKKPVKGYTPGTFRATFEDKLRRSDIIFLRAWYPVELVKYCNPVTNHTSKHWKGMRTVWELRQLRNLHAPRKEDSQYKPISRPNEEFDPLKVPDKLQHNLPFHLQKNYAKKTEHGKDLSDLSQEQKDLTKAIYSNEERKRLSKINKLQAFAQQLKIERQKEETAAELQRIKEEQRAYKDVKSRFESGRKRRMLQTAKKAAKKARYDY